MNIEIRKSSFTQVTPGTVKATVVGFDEAPEHAQYGPSMLVTFSVSDGAVEEIVKCFWTPVCSPKSNLGLLCAKAGVEPKSSWKLAGFAKALVNMTIELEAHRNEAGWTRLRHNRGA